MRLPTTSEIQNGLARDEILPDYFIRKIPISNEAELTVFLVSRHKIEYKKMRINNDFFSKLALVRANSALPTLTDAQFTQTNQALFDLYRILIEPFKDKIEGKDIVVIPDEELAYLSFDMLLSDYNPASEMYFSNLNYLIKQDYRFRYALSAYTLHDRFPERAYSAYVYAFAPQYSEKNGSGITKLDLKNLPNQTDEVRAVLRHFAGEAFYAKHATIRNFKSVLQRGGIIFYTGHALAGIYNFENSQLTLVSEIDSADIDFFNFDAIRNLDIRSPFVILSACQTGDGKLLSGEGIMNLTAAFYQASVPATMHTLWTVDAETSLQFMDEFTKLLAEGQTKSEALRLAKLHYINTCTEEQHANPYFWAGYITTSDNSPVIQKSSEPTVWILVAVVALLTALFAILKFRK